MKSQIILYYNDTDIENPELLKQQQEELCRSLNLKGRIIIAKEGINGTLQGDLAQTSQYVRAFASDERFAKTHFKYSDSDIDAFPKLSIKVRPEIVSGHLGPADINPTKVTGKYLQPEELHEWFKSGKEFYIVDMRNSYEHEVGFFKDAILPPLHNFRDLPNVLPLLEDKKQKTILTVCTGGVRCEKASGYLVNNGFNDVYQLYGGIVSYMEKYPNQDFLGKLYVFDGRFTMGFNLDSPEHQVVSNCSSCGKKSDNYIDCYNIHCKGHRHMIRCQDCLAEGKGYCKDCEANGLG